MVKANIEWIDDKFGFVSDIRDNHKYKCVRIGTQIWMAENLSYAPKNEPLIRNINNKDNWVKNKDADGWCYYENDQAQFEKYGVLYQWKAAKRACLVGWSIPTDLDWKILEDYLLQNLYEFEHQRTDNEIAKAVAFTAGWKPSDDEGDVGFLQQQNNFSGFSAI